MSGIIICVRKFYAIKIGEKHTHTNTHSRLRFSGSGSAETEQVRAHPKREDPNKPQRIVINVVAMQRLFCRARPRVHVCVGIYARGAMWLIRWDYWRITPADSLISRITGAKR